MLTEKGFLAAGWVETVDPVTGKKWQNSYEPLGNLLGTDPLLRYLKTKSGQKIVKFLDSVLRGTQANSLEFLNFS